MLTETQFLTELARLIGELQQLTLRRLALIERAAEGFNFFQIHRHGVTTKMITGAAPGQSCRIVETPIPAGGQLQAGSALTWSTSDQKVSLAPSADGTSVVCAIDPTNTNNNFSLHLDGTNSAGAAISGDVSVPIQQPVSVPATGFSFDQAPV